LIASARWVALNEAWAGAKCPVRCRFVDRMLSGTWYIRWNKHASHGWLYCLHCSTRRLPSAPAPCPLWLASCCARTSPIDLVMCCCFGFDPRTAMRLRLFFPAPEPGVHTPTSPCGKNATNDSVARACWTRYRRGLLARVCPAFTSGRHSPGTSHSPLLGVCQDKYLPPRRCAIVCHERVQREKTRCVAQNRWFDYSSRPWT